MLKSKLYVLWFPIRQKPVNVIVALQIIPQGMEVFLEDGCKVAANVEVPAGHKMAIQDIPAGGEVIKYGYRIGNDLVASGKQVCSEAAGFHDMAIFKQGVTL